MTKRKTLLLFNYRAVPGQFGFGRDDAAMVLAPATLASYLMRNGRSGVAVTVSVRDQAEPQELTLKNIYRAAPDIAGFGCYVWNFAATLELTRKLRLVAPATRIILGGPEVSDKAYSVSLLARYPWIDAIVRGEGEETLERLMSGACADRDIPGLTFRAGNRIVANPGHPRLPDLSVIPSVYTGDFVRDVPMMYYAASRGCAGRCKYCQEWSRKRNLPLDRVREDLKVIFKSRRMKILSFIDSVLDDDMERLYGLLEITAELNVRGVPVSGYFYFKNPAPELFDRLERAHFKYLRVGIETHKSEALQHVGRGKGNLSRIDNVLPHRDRFSIIPYIISHLPGETPDSFRDTLKVCFRKGLMNMDLHCNRLDIFPGTWFFQHGRELGYTYDESPPHHVFAARGWPYERFIRDKTYLRNLLILGKVFNPGDEAVLAGQGLDLFKMAERIHEVSPSWASAYSSLTSYTISDMALHEDLPLAFADYARRAVPDKAVREALVRLFVLRFYTFLARRIPEDFMGCREFTADITLDSVVFLPFFHGLKPGPDVTRLEEHPGLRFEDLPVQDKSTFILGRFPQAGSFYFATDEHVMAERILHTLRENQENQLCAADLLRQFTRAQREQFIRMLVYLRDQHALLTHDPAQGGDHAEEGATP